jgi:hypothetical protein
MTWDEDKMRGERESEKEGQKEKGKMHIFLDFLLYL